MGHFLSGLSVLTMNMICEQLCETISSQDGKLGKKYIDLINYND